MSLGHGHTGQGVPPAWAGQRHRSRLWAAFGILLGFMLIEAAAAWWTGSLALLSDASHMATDVLGIGLALAAITTASRAASRTGVSDRTFGLYRLEVLAALANAVLLGGVTCYVLVEAVRRLGDPPQILAGPMLAVGAAGLAANVIAFGLLRTGARESLNVRGAYLEVLGDLFTSAAVILAAAVIALTDWWYADPIVAAAAAILILPRTWMLGRSALRVLVQAAPAHVKVAEVRQTLAAVPGVCDVHDLHVWTLTSGMEVASAHLTIDAADQLGDVLATARGALHDRYGIDHATLQVEPAGGGACRPADW